MKNLKNNNNNKKCKCINNKCNCSLGINNLTLNNNNLIINNINNVIINDDEGTNFRNAVTTFNNICFQLITNVSIAIDVDFAAEE